MFSKKYLSHYKKNIALAIPVCLSQLGHITVGIADTVMAATLGPIPLASTTFALSAFIPFLMLCIGFSYGITPVIAQASGGENNSDLSIFLKNALITNMLFNGGLVFILFMASPILYFFHQPPEIIPEAIRFFQIMVFSLLPLQIFCVYKQFLEGLSLTHQSMFISIIGNVLNIILNYIFVFGKFGSPSLGLMGVAYATLVSRIFMAGSILTLFYFKKAFKKYRFKVSVNTIEPQMIKKIIVMSLPIAFQLALETGAFGMAAIMAGWLGTKELAAHQIALNLAAVTYMIAVGISAAATIRVGNEMGKDDIRDVETSGLSSYYLVIMYELLCTGILLIFRNQLPQLYITDFEIVSLASSLLLIAAFFQISDGLQVVGLGVLRGISDIKVPTSIAIISYWVVGLPMAYYLGFIFNLGLRGIWYGLLIGLSTAAILIFLRFRIIIKRLSINI